MESRTMRAVRLVSKGLLTVSDIGIDAPDAGQVLVAVEMSGLGRTHLGLVTGRTHGGAPLPRTLGHEIVGRIAQLGSAGSELTVGMRVMVDSLISCGRCEFCARGRHQLCGQRTRLGMNRDGGWAEYVLVPIGQVHQVPDHVPDADAVLGTSALPTAVHACRRAGIQPGQSVAVFGLGSMGLLCCQLARIFGAAEVIGVNRSGSRLTIAAPYLDEAIPAADQEPSALARSVRCATSDQLGVDVAIEASGSKELTAAAVQALNRGGTLLSVGIPTETSELAFGAPAGDFIGREISLVAANSHSQADFGLARQLLIRKRIDFSPLIGDEIALTDIPDVIRRVADPSSRSGTRHMVRVAAPDQADAGSR